MFFNAIVAAETQGWLQSSSVGSKVVKQSFLRLTKDTNATRPKTAKRDLDKGLATAEG
jgi:hypothetical protein